MLAYNNPNPTPLCCLGPLQVKAVEKHHEHQTPPQLLSQYPSVHLRSERSSSLADPKSNTFMLRWTLEGVDTEPPAVSGGRRKAELSSLLQGLLSTSTARAGLVRAPLSRQRVDGLLWHPYAVESSLGYNNMIEQTTRVEPRPLLAPMAMITGQSARRWTPSASTPYAVESSLSYNMIEQTTRAEATSGPDGDDNGPDWSCRHMIASAMSIGKPSFAYFPVDYLPDMMCGGLTSQLTCENEISTMRCHTKDPKTL
ncbi:hypothetical protein THAOC_02928 [Thalassiosira oceanica]|uniref:Uncharacterized protein n=1 Tax=Thalassiosira oceanica TaxID=159749 RepID=K0TD35_THAOC|nr:hypothetical protein THAOC_02928 [Thalassiosira oceanica]|eukprot:EJK75345.1 hypothetical protein THAOC_02928 [Thalassiosira oceanica]